LTRNGRRKRGNIWPQLWVSAGLLLLPPLAMAAGVIVLGSYSSDGHGSGPLQPTVSQTTIAKSVSLEERPDESSVSRQPPIAKDPSRYDAPVGETANGPPVAKKDPARYYDSIPVALVHVWKSREHLAMADIEAAPSTVTASPRADDTRSAPWREARPSLQTVTGARMAVPFFEVGQDG
jgi:hypothetical protein